MKPVWSWSARALAPAAVVLSLALPPVSAQEPGPSAAVAAERLTIKFSNGTFELLSRTSTRKVLPPSDALPQGQRLPAGFWYEHRSAEGALRYRRIVENPVLLVFEGPDGEKPGKPDRKEGLPAERIFSVLIPQSAVGDSLALFSSPLQPEAQGQPAQQVALLAIHPPVIG